VANWDKSLRGTGQARTHTAPVVARVVAVRRLNLPPAANSNRQPAGQWLRQNGGKLIYGLFAAVIVAMVVAASL